ncbi:hypothetical protein ACFFMN_21175 [Planobispora siamensis]|uniref:Uncharacterized protein n=1 Tax=Planobispora siamensis TaxID=936338 RepID=A0A8J3SG03_9ACTN|nr:hypothetical protein [Planobispora siamensis]GIH93652.1 hypothetical protein Psi01_42820 [Planobispora siamensis]
MIRRFLAGAAIAGFAGLIFAGPAAASCDWGNGGGGGGSTYIENHENNVLNDLLDVALLGFIEN